MASSNQRLKESMVNEAWQSFANHILRLSDKIVDYYEGDQKEASLEVCKKSMASCCEMEEEYMHRKFLVEQTSAVMSDEDNERAINDVYNEFKDQSKFNPRDGKDNQKYNNLLLVIRDAEKRVGQRGAGTSAAADDDEADEEQEEEEDGEDDDEEDEPQMTQVLVNTTDPITKLEMKDPVMSSKCKHSFERNSIMSLLKDKARVRCPTPGCGWITASDIVPNLELKRIIDERGARRQRKRK